jgi:methionyl-tRNA formyltransferase
MCIYLVASSKPWFDNAPKSEEYQKLKTVQIHKKEELTLELLEELNPRYIFFPHWSWIVPQDVFSKYECVIFHTAPLPFGRGGSPIQNLILHGLKNSPVCALRMSETLDGGPIYSSKNVSLEGTIDEIFARIAKCVADLIVSICQVEPSPKPQIGEVSFFKRLSPQDNELKPDLNLESLYDRIRMVDSDMYLRAYVPFGDRMIEFSQATLEGDEMVAQVRFVERKKR